MTSFSEYCFKIFVDEAQDIDEDMKTVLEALDGTGIDIELFGDPKQDVKRFTDVRQKIDVRTITSALPVAYGIGCHADHSGQRFLLHAHLLSIKTDTLADHRHHVLCCGLSGIHINNVALR